METGGVAVFEGRDLRGRPCEGKQRGWLLRKEHLARHALSAHPAARILAVQ